MPKLGFKDLEDDRESLLTACIRDGKKRCGKVCEAIKAECPITVTREVPYYCPLDGKMTRFGCKCSVMYIPKEAD